MDPSFPWVFVFYSFYSLSVCFFQFGLIYPRGSPFAFALAILPWPSTDWVIGAVYLHRKGYQGWERVPNNGFWSTIPGACGNFDIIDSSLTRH